MIYQVAGGYQQALSYYEEALMLFRKLEWQGDKGFTLGDLGFAYDLIGEYQQALIHYQEALKIHRERGDKLVEGVIMNNIGHG